MADKRASKPVVAANIIKSNEVRTTNHPQTARAPSLTKQMNFMDLKEDYFKERNIKAGTLVVDEENKDNDDESVYHSLKENYLNYRSSSQPNREFLQEHGHLTPKS